MSSLTHITKCTLCPPDKPVRIVADQIPQVKPGEQPPEAVGRYVQALSAHLQKKHPEAFQRALGIGQTLIAYLILQNFETTDPGVATGRNLTRAFVHRLTRKNDITEAEIQYRLAGLGVDGSNEHAQEFAREFRDIRDLLLEEGEYTPEAPEVTENLIVR
jgi:hypothetical protein